MSDTEILRLIVVHVKRKGRTFLILKHDQSMAEINLLLLAEYKESETDRERFWSGFVHITKLTIFLAVNGTRACRIA